MKKPPAMAAFSIVGRVRLAGPHFLGRKVTKEWFVGAARRLGRKCGGSVAGACHRWHARDRTQGRRFAPIFFGTTESRALTQSRVGSGRVPTAGRGAKGGRDVYKRQTVVRAVASDQ